MPKDYNTTLPRDSQGNPIPVLGVLPGGGKKVAVGAASARTATDFAKDVQVITLYATENMHIEFGDATAVALNDGTSHYLVKGVYRDFAVNDRGELSFTRVAAIRDTADGTLYVTQRV